MEKSEAGKGDDPRPMDISREEFDNNYQAWLEKKRKAREQEEEN